MTKRFAAIGLLCAILAGCGGGDDGDKAGNAAASGNEADANVQAAQARGPIGDALARSADHSAFVEALRAVGLFETLQGGAYTVFAPTNAAFDALPQDVRNGLAAPARREQTIALLSYHIVPGTVTAADLGAAIDRGEGRAELATVTGGNLSLSREGETIIVGDGRGGQARLTAADQAGANGIVHSIDTVLMPGR